MRSRNDIRQADAGCASVEMDRCGLNLVEVRCDPCDEDANACSCGGRDEGRSASAGPGGVECFGGYEYVSFGAPIVECVSEVCESDCACCC